MDINKEDMELLNFYNQKAELIKRKDKQLAKPKFPSKSNIYYTIDSLEAFKDYRKEDNAISYRVSIINSLLEFRYVLIHACAYYELINLMPDKLKYSIAYETKIKIDTSFLFLFSILEKIAQLIIVKCDLNIPEEKANFNKIWSDAQVAIKNEKLKNVFPIIKDLCYSPLWHKLREIRDYRTHMYDPSFYFDCIEKRIPEISFTKEERNLPDWYEIDENIIENIKQDIEDRENVEKLEKLNNLRGCRNYVADKIKSLVKEEKLKNILSQARKFYELIYNKDANELKDKVIFRECEVLNENIRYVLNDIEVLKDKISAEAINILQKSYITSFMYLKNDWPEELNHIGLKSEEIEEVMNVLKPTKTKEFSREYKGCSAVLALNLLELGYNSLLDSTNTLLNSLFNKISP